MKNDGIDISGIIQKVNGEEFTEDEHDAFMDAFIEWIEVMGLTFGGGTHLIDTDDD